MDKFSVKIEISCKRLELEILMKNEMFQKEWKRHEKTVKNKY